MEIRKKRALLARIDGQLAATVNGRDQLPKYRLRVKRALEVLGNLPLNHVEAGYRDRMSLHLDAFFNPDDVDCPENLQRHRNMLVRADCVLWQMHLRRRSAA